MTEKLDINGTCGDSEIAVGSDGYFLRDPSFPSFREGVAIDAHARNDSNDGPVVL